MPIDATQSPRGPQAACYQAAASCSHCPCGHRFPAGARGGAASPAGNEPAARRITRHQLGELHGIAYYTVEDAGYGVVATLAGQDSTPVRFVSMLLPGQKVVVSIPAHRGSQGQTVEFARQGHRMLVDRTPPGDRLGR